MFGRFIIILVLFSIVSLYSLNKSKNIKKIEYIIISLLLIVTLFVPEIINEINYDNNIAVIGYIFQHKPSSTDNEISDFCSQSTMNKIKELKGSYDQIDNLKINIDKIINNTFILSVNNESRKIIFIFKNEIGLDEGFNLIFIKDLEVFSVVND